MMRYIFSLILVVVFAGVTQAQSIPEIDSLIKARANNPHEIEENLELTRLSMRLFRQYGGARLKQQINDVFRSNTLSTNSKLTFTHLLQPLMVGTGADSDSLLSYFSAALREAYMLAPDKCEAMPLLEIIGGLNSVEKKYVVGKEQYDALENEIRKQKCGEALISFHLGISRDIFMPLGNHAKAAEHHMKALHILDSLRKIDASISPVYEYSVYTALANLNYHVGNYAQAITYWQQTLNLINREKRWMNAITGIYNNMGLAYRNLKQHDKSIEYLRQCLQLAEQTHDEAWIGIATGNMGVILLEEGKFSEAIPLLEKDIRLSKVNYQYGSLTNAYAKIAECYAGLNNYAKAKACYDSSLSSFERWPKPISFGSSTYRSLALVYRNYADLEHKQGHFKEAFFYKQKSVTFDDSLKNMQKRHELTLLQSYHAFEKQDAENKLLKAKVKTQSLRETVIIILVVLGAMILVSAIIIYRLRLRRVRAEAHALDAAKQVELEKALRLEEDLKSSQAINQLREKQTQEQLALRERELSSITVQIQQKNEVMVGLKSQLEKIAQKESALQDDLKSLYKSVRNDLNLSADWEKFKVHFEQVHPDFFTRLNEAYPDISLSDLRICAYLRMNMDNASIAHILNVSPDSLRVRRHRLRKRMGFQTDKEIYNYLAAL